MANYFYHPGCRRRFILEYFNQVPKFFWCNYCDNCCEDKMIDMTNKFIEVIFNKGKYNEVFKPKELELLTKHNLIIETNASYYEPLITIKNWKKIIEANKYLTSGIKGIPNKYLIKIKKL
jgi:superfamily II DNA helicase RecQ